MWALLFLLVSVGATLPSSPTKPTLSTSPTKPTAPTSPTKPTGASPAYQTQYESASASQSSSSSSSSSSTSNSSTTFVKGRPPKIYHCPPDEVYYKCRLDRCSNTCEDLKKPPICPPIAPGCIQPACLCKAGYYKNSHNKCVPADQCGKEPSKCGYNEKPVKCRTICPPQNCDLPYTTYLCDKPLKCERGCDCLDGYWRNSSGICIPQEQCPGPTPVPICGYNEEPVPCRTICPPQNCDLPYTDYFCAQDIKCEPGCDCIADHFRNSSGICVPSKECGGITTEPPLSGKCSVNETEVQCKQFCPPQSCNVSYTEYACNIRIVCLPGCNCKENYLRNASGICILNEECPPPTTTELPPSDCPPDEEYYKCRLDRCSNTCEDLIKPPICPPIAPGCIQPGCLCKAGYYRNSHNKCVPADQCGKATTTEPPPSGKCSVNETEAQCKQICPPQSCNISYTEYNCNIPIACIPGCDCKENYLRNASGICILNEECPPPTTEPPPSGKCSVNETEAQCKRICPPQSCNISYTEYNCNIPIACIPGCDCKENYLRNASGICILNEECPPPTTEPPPSGKCSVNETEAQCKQICPPQSCNISYTEYNCNIPIACTPGCDCKENYLRNASGICILNEECPPPPVIEPLQCGYNEEEVPCLRSCPPQLCDALYFDFPCAYKEGCDRGCACISGHLRNSSGICTPKDQCPPPPVKEPLPCGYNEVEVPCFRPCPPQSCDALYLDYLCAYQEGCDRGCACISGHLRNSSGYCVPTTQCPFPPWIIKPVPCGKNETYAECKQTCPPQSCNISYTSYLCPENQVCESGCDCKENYLRNSTGHCILNDECKPPQVITVPPVTEPPVTVTPITEPPVTVTPITEPPVTGTPITEPPVTATPVTEPPVTGTPITEPPVTSPPIECGPNQTIVDCTFKCPNLFCLQNDDQVTYACKPPRDCPSGCGCQMGYKYLSYDNLTCVLAQDCPPVECTRPNEEFAFCPSSCLAEDCENANDLPTFCAEPLYRDCQPKCICKSGYYRNKSGICVVREDCITCGPNQINVPCNVNCPTEFCPTTDSRFEVACSVSYPCPIGCACKENYFKKSYENQTCILKQECPPVECTRQNEVFNPCAQSCLAESCQDVDGPKFPCADDGSCNPKCVCAEGFYRNEEDICVSKEECKKCKPNEQYVYCKAGCSTDYCLTDDSLAVVACDPPYPCPSGCICKLNYKRLSYNNDTCVPVQECPPVTCTRPHEVYNSCSSNCLSESCLDVDKPLSDCYNRTQYCVPKCVCEEGYYRNESEICVLKEDCKKCPPNERYVECKGYCQSDYCPTDNRPVTPCDDPSPYCSGGCVCNENYKRQSYDNSTCIPADECPPPTAQSPPTPGEPVPLPVPVAPTPPQEPISPPATQCGPNSSPISCDTKCSDLYCPTDDSLTPKPCPTPEPCSEGCICSLNYKKLSLANETCVVSSTCPEIPCTRENEEWCSCPSPCIRESCPDIYDQATTCNYLVLNCQPRCICKKGYFRNETGFCVAINKCPEFHGGPFKLFQNCETSSEE